MRLYPKMEFIIITGFASVDNTISALNRDAFAFIEKPIDISYLKSILSNVVKKQRLDLEKEKFSEKLEKEVKLRTFELNQT